MYLFRYILFHNVSFVHTSSDLISNPFSFFLVIRIKIAQMNTHNLAEKHKRQRQILTGLQKQQQQYPQTEGGGPT